MEVTTYRHPYNIEVKNVWSCNSSIRHKCMTVNRDNCTLVTKSSSSVRKVKEKGEIRKKIESRHH